MVALAAPLTVFVPIFLIDTAGTFFAAATVTEGAADGRGAAAETATPEKASAPVATTASAR